MASCENCHQKVPAEQVLVATRGEEKILIGRCCVAEPSLNPTPQLNFHLEVSSVRGVSALAEYGDFKVSFHKSPQDMKQYIAKNFPNVFTETQLNGFTH